MKKKTSISLGGFDPKVEVALFLSFHNIVAGDDGDCDHPKACFLALIDRLKEYWKSDR